MSKNDEDDMIMEEDDDIEESSDSDGEVVDDSGDDEDDIDNTVLDLEDDLDDDIEDDNIAVDDEGGDDDDDVDIIMKENDVDIQDDDEDDDDHDDDDEDDKNYLQKINAEMSSDIIANNHHELKTHNAEEVEVMCKVVRNVNGTIIDPLHTTLPFLTRYEIANIIGNRATQIEAGAIPFVEVKDNIIDSYTIALSEFKQKKIPYIIRRPLPNGGSEYWKFADLEQLD
jgi:DNA-directed RNA polymerase subunit K/omega